MSPAGFEMVELRVTGPDKAPAGMPFRPGLNVISGASDTGKSYILGLIDYMMGASTRPRAIPQAFGYETAFLSVRSKANGHIYTLERSLRGGDLRLYEGGIDGREQPRTLREKHQADRDDTVSAFLLRLSNLANRKVLSKKTPPQKTQSLSFRNITKLFIIDEVRVIDEGSPILSGQYTQRTLENSVFRVLLSGVDDSSIVSPEGEDPKVSKTRHEGQVAMLAQMIASNETEVTTLRQTQSERGLESSNLDSAIQEALAVRDQQQQALQRHEADRQKAWKELRRIESRVGYVEQLLHRFRLLETQYLSDLSRLQAVAEAEHAFAQFEAQMCPVCGAPDDRHQHEGVKGYDVSEIREASRREAKKLHGLLTDLRATIGEADTERTGLEENRMAARATLDGIAQVIDRELAPVVRISSNKLSDLIAHKSSLSRLEFLVQQLVSYRTQHLDLVARAPVVVTAAPTVAGPVEANEVDALCLVIGELLRAWRFPGPGRVVYEEGVQDFAIDGRSRGSRGKGIRALTYAAFVLGLMKYGLEHDRPHPGLVIIDSPLVAYKEPDPEGENLSPDVKHAFYSTLADGLAQGQIVILENEDPTSEVAERMNYVHFSGSGNGRSGFFPVA
jgi:hypothetical protein